MTRLAPLLFAILLPTSRAGATPSTQIWIPSTDVQPFAVTHLNIDTFVHGRNEGDGTRRAPMSAVGPTIGFLPWGKLQAEAGFDLIHEGDASADGHPLYLHAKLGTPEDSLAAGSPALAVGGYDFGTKRGVTDQDVLYGMAARTVPVIGRLSAGYYAGNRAVLVDGSGRRSGDGALLSWDRTMKEVSDRLWFAVDYQGGRSVLGSTNFGFAWAFSPKTSVILGYDVWTDHAVAGRDSFTLQVDINL